MLDDGEIERRVRLIRPMEQHGIAADDDGADPLARGRPRDLRRAPGRPKLAEVPEFTDSTIHIVTGLLLPIWKRLPDESTRVYRLQTDDGERIIGRKVSPAWVASALATGAVDADAGRAPSPRCSTARPSSTSPKACSFAASASWARTASS